MSSGTDAVDTGAADTGKTAGTVAETDAFLRALADVCATPAAVTSDPSTSQSTPHPSTCSTGGSAGDPGKETT